MVSAFNYRPIELLEHESGTAGASIKIQEH
jgi:hypothetical protein